MKQSIKNAIYQAISEGKRLDVTYQNAKGEVTKYNIGILDLDIKNNRIYCDIFNSYKNSLIINGRKGTPYIFIDKIKSASVIEQSYYDVPKDLLDKINTDKNILQFLDTIKFDNNILAYLSDSYRYDNDPFLKEVVMINGIDLHQLSRCEYYKLSDEQFNELLNKVFKKDPIHAEEFYRYQTLAINKFSIDFNDKQYVVAFRILHLNFKNKTLKVDRKSSINKSFLIKESKKVVLSSYLDIDPNYFAEKFDEKEEEFINLIKENFHHNEKVNTRPTIFTLKRNAFSGVDEALESILEMDKTGKLTVPLKAFFGRNKSKNNAKLNSNLIIFDKNKINIDQLRVVYNSMANHVTYVKGPPGTGKTETIFNVILSAYFSDKTVLVCSNNNHPVNDIFKKMENSIKFANNFGNVRVIFPIIRLGNLSESRETILRIRDVLGYIQEKNNIKTSERLTKGSKDSSLNVYEELKNYLVSYETKLNTLEKVDKLQKIRMLTTINQVIDKIDTEINTSKEEIRELNKNLEKDVFNYLVSASEDKNFQNFIFFSSINKYKKLLSNAYKELREIVLIENLEEAALRFNKWIKDDENLKKLLNVFPIILTTNLSSAKLGSPRPHFDLVVMDEAGQCNIAASLIPIVRGVNLLLIGDTNQLQPVTVIEEHINEKLRRKYNIKDEYDYVHNSILSTMLKKDNNSKNILLRYHYRCGSKIAEFVNKRFYEEQLKLLNKNPGALEFIDIKNDYFATNKNSYIEEANQIVKTIKENNYKDVGIVTPFVNQAYLINLLLKREGIQDVKAGTIHSLQGSEKSVIIFSSALSLKTSKKTMDWIKNAHELINVAVTRAKQKFIFVGDKEAIDKLCGDDNSDIKVLADYVFKNGDVTVPKCEKIMVFDFSNESKNEKDFFVTIQPYFNRRGSKFRILRNVKVKDAIKNIYDDDYAKISKKEFDIVIQVGAGLLRKKYETIVVFEIDGGEHIGDKRTALRDRIKEEVCAKYNIKLIRIPNSAVKDYELIINLFEKVTNIGNRFGSQYEQISLLEDA